MKSDAALLNQKAVTGAALANHEPISATLQEKVELVRFLYRALKNYRVFAPMTRDPHAKECAALWLEELFLGATREAIEEHYRGGEKSRQRLIEREIARMEDVPGLPE